MDKPFRKLDTALKHPVVMLAVTTIGFVSSVVSIVAFFGLPGLSFGAKSGMILTAAVAIFVFAYLVFIFGLFRLYSDNKAIRDATKYLRDVQYGLKRDAFEICYRFDPQTPEIRLLQEKAAVERACRLICNLFQRLTGRECHICVTLVTREPSSSLCFVWACSEGKYTREADSIRRFDVRKNTRLWAACKPTNHGEPACFYSADLRDDLTYEDELDNWRSFYVSTLVVPIRGVATDYVGFFKLETRFPNRLNNKLHLHILTICADALYTFFLISRACNIKNLAKPPFVDLVIDETNGLVPIEPRTNAFNKLAYRLVMEDCRSTDARQKVKNKADQSS